MTSVWGRHNPFVMRLVESLVNAGVMETAMDEVDPEIGKHQKQRELKPHVDLPIILNVLVKV